MDAINKRLKEYREEHKLNTGAIAMVVNISEDDYIAIEQGQADMTVPQLMKLCSFYGIKPDEFLVAHVPETKLERDEDKPRARNKTKPVGEVFNANDDDDKEFDYPSIYDLNRSKRTVTAKKAVEIYKKHGTDITEEDAEKVLDFVYKMAPIAISQVMRQAKWDKRLERYPYGYAMNGKGYSCRLCGHGQDEDQMWYDKFGLKCMPCQKAIDKGVIPGKIVGDDTLYYSEHDLDHYFKLKGKVLKEWIKKSLLKPRTIPRTDGKGKHYQVFLISEHEGFLPPITMMRIGGLVEEEEEDGKKYIRGTQWYEHVDPFEYLKDYGIMAYMKRTDEEDQPSEEIGDKKE